MRDILIIKPSSIGDVVHSLPVLAKVRAAHPEARISWLIGAAAAPLLESDGRIDRLFRFTRNEKRPLQAARKHFALVKSLAWESFDCVIDLQGLLRSALFSFAARAPMRVGLSDAREGAGLFYTHKVDTSGATHAVDRYLKTGDVLGFDTSSPEFMLEIPRWASDSVKRILSGAEKPFDRPYFVLSPGARWQSKRWPAANFTETARLLLEKFGGTAFIVGAKSEAGAAATEIAKGIGPSAVNLVGRTSLAEVAALISAADLLVTPDTGLVHIADAIGTPLVAVFGPTDAARTGPYFQSEHVVTTSGACNEAPCFKRTCQSGECMRGISAADVFACAVDVLEGAA